MSDEDALLKAIIANADEDTPRLAYADWLDENRPDTKLSPSSGPSARAEYIRVQCRLAAGAFDLPEYPELLEREQDLADWLNTHDSNLDSERNGIGDAPLFNTGEWEAFRRGFLEMFEFSDFEIEARSTVKHLVEYLKETFAGSTARTLSLTDVNADEMILLARQPIFAQLRGLSLSLDSLSSDAMTEDDAAQAIAVSPKSMGLRRLYLDFPLEVEGCRALARSRYLGNLETLVIDYPIPTAAVKELARGKWFRNLRRLGLSSGVGDLFRVLSDLPGMPRLVSLTVNGSVFTRPAAIRRFAASESFPRLAHLSLEGARLPAESVALLARGTWPLRHLDLSQNYVRRVGAEALTAAPFAATLRVLELHECEITAGGVQALTDAEALAGLRHLDLAGNPIGSGGLHALAASPHLRGLRALDLGHTNTARGPIAVRDVSAFLAALDTPELRHLTMDGLPVGVRGARMLASSTAFANLTRLRLERCGLNERGVREILGSKSLAGLVMLALSGNNLGAAAAKLANPKVFPRLGRCRLDHNIPQATMTRLRRRPGIEG